MVAAKIPMWIAVPPSLLQLDTPAALQIRDPYGKLLVDRGAVIADAQLLQRIQSIGLCNVEELGQIEEVESQVASPVRTTVRLEEFHLGPGTLLFLSPAGDAQPDSLPAQLIGIIPGEDLLVRPTAGGAQENLCVRLARASSIDVRLAVGQDVLRFVSPLRLNCPQPYWYQHLGWPADVTLQQDRLCPRLPVHQPVLIEHEGEVRRSALLLNLSEQGALVQYHTRLGKAGDTLLLRFVLPTEQGHHTLALPGIIRNRHTGMHSSDVVLHGIEFSHLDDAEMQAIRRHVQRGLLAAANT